jgi:hypothetical protein
VKSAFDVIVTSWVGLRQYRWGPDPLKRLARTVDPERVRRVALALLAILATVLLVLSPVREFFLGVVVGGLGAISVPRLLRRRRREPVVPGLHALLLELARRGWAVSHDDQIAVGPGGAYLLEERKLNGRVALADGSLVVSRGDDEAWRMSDGVAGRIRASAKDARRVLGAANLHWVRPVVVLWCDFPAGVAEHAGVTYVHGYRLVRWLTEQPEIVSPQSLESARSCLRRLEVHATRAA